MFRPLQSTIAIGGLVTFLWLPGIARGQVNLRLVQQQQMIQRQMLMYEQMMVLRQQQMQAYQQMLARQQVIGYSFTRDKNGKLVKTPEVVYSKNGNTYEIGPAQRLTNVKYIGDPQITRRLPDGSLIYLWNLASFGFKPGQTVNVDPHYMVPAGATAVISGQAGIKGVPWLFVFIPFRPVDQQTLAKDIQLGLGVTAPVQLGGP